jgi:hypothetical protein
MYRTLVEQDQEPVRRRLMRTGGLMRIRAGLVAALLLAALAPDAVAAKPVCRIVQDARGDAEYPTNGVPGDDGDDLLSADLASDGRQLTAVWRLAALRVPNPSSPLGQSFVAYFQVSGSTRVFFLHATTATAPASFWLGYMEDSPTGPRTRSAGAGKGLLDSVRGEVRMTVPTRSFLPVGGRIVRGARLRSVEVFSSRVLVPPTTALSGVNVWLAFDDAQGESYVVGTPSCARPVR